MGANLNLDDPQGAGLNVHMYSCKYLGTCRNPRLGPPDSIAAMAKNLPPGWNKHTWGPVDPEELRPSPHLPPHLGENGNHGAPVGVLDEAAMRVAGSLES